MVNAKSLVLKATPLIPPVDTDVVAWLASLDRRPSIIPCKPVSPNLVLVALIMTEPEQPHAWIINQDSAVDDLFEGMRNNAALRVLFFTVLRSQVVPTSATVTRQ